jgi:hypothetical protein
MQHLDFRETDELLARFMVAEPQGLNRGVILGEDR